MSQDAVSSIFLQVIPVLLIGITNIIAAFVFGAIAVNMAKKRGLRPVPAFFAGFFASFVALFFIAMFPKKGEN